MDTETRAAIAALAETMNAGFARMEARMDAGFGDANDRVARMEARVDAGFGDVNDRFAHVDALDAGFARIDRFIELQQVQHLELRGEFAGLRAEVRELRDRVDALTERVGGLEREVAQLRDHVTREIAEVRLELRELRTCVGQTDELRREIAQLTVRVDRLERRQPD